jgi:signal transduction histidine kinase
MGWLELMQHESEGRDSMLKILGEMEVDVQRIDKVVSRFSQIGSVSELKRQNLVPILQELVEYFRKRVPQLGKRVVLEEDYKADPSPYVNPQLFAWVVENVIKNAVDAIEDRDGLIRVSLEHTNNLVLLDIKDNGRGIALKNRDNVFRPGYSTKKRGWGLGLSLARRIIEDYHKGKIFVKESKPGEGTTIRIQLKDN